MSPLVVLTPAELIAANRRYLALLRTLKALP